MYTFIYLASQLYIHRERGGTNKREDYLFPGISIFSLKIFN